jgi:hypothetical protein
MGRTGHLAGTKPSPGSCAGKSCAQRKGGVGYIHIPVLFQAVLDGLRVRPGGRYIDATVGGGGHAAGILEASSPDGSLLGLDRDPAAVEMAYARLASYAGLCRECDSTESAEVPAGRRVVLLHGSFSRLAEIARACRFVPADGILFDLGISSLQLADPTRGFAFMGDGPLDMRFDPTEDGYTAAALVNHLPLGELTALLYRYCGGDCCCPPASHNEGIGRRRRRGGGEARAYPSGHAHVPGVTYRRQRRTGRAGDSVAPGRGDTCAWRPAGGDRLSLAGRSAGEAVSAPGEPRLYLSAGGAGLYL